MATRLEITNREYNLLGERTDSTIYDKDTYLAPLTNELQDSICKGEVVNVQTGQQYKSPFLRFLATKQFLQTAQDENTTAAIATTDTTISVAATNFADSGYVRINGDIIQYTGKTSTTLTGVTNINGIHASGTPVSQVYKIPSTAYKGFEVRKIEDGIETQIPFLDDRARKDIYLYYTIVTDSSTTDEFILIRGMNSSGKEIVFDYYTTSTDMSTDSSDSTLPDPYGLQVLAPLVAGTILYNTDEVQRGITYLNMAYANLQQMYSHYGVRVKEYRRKLKTDAFDLSGVGLGSYFGTTNYQNCKYR